MDKVKTVEQAALTIWRRNIYMFMYTSSKTILKEINNSAKHKYINTPQLIELAFPKTEKDSF